MRPTRWVKGLGFWVGGFRVSEGLLVFWGFQGWHMRPTRWVERGSVMGVGLLVTASLTRRNRWSPFSVNN
jgi:hypothetical protein